MQAGHFYPYDADFQTAVGGCTVNGDVNVNGALTKNSVPVATVQTQYWYVEGSEENPLIVEKDKSYIFSDPYGGFPVIYSPQIYIDKTQSGDGKARWVEINSRFSYGDNTDDLSFKTAEIVADDGSISYEIGIRSGINSAAAPHPRLSQIPDA